ncbi:hypothetical protein [Embleya sp. NPDC005971]|uniref:hypothetical protein n=1 Tax=unclassified Embleya TaxID=2699296 RepID=UPI0033D89317
MTLTRGIVTYAAVVTLSIEALAASIGCGVVAPIVFLNVLADRYGDRPEGRQAIAGTVGVTFLVLLALVITIWSIWAVSNLRDRLRTGSTSRVGLIGAAGMHVAASAVALLFPLVLAATLPILALLLAATLATRPRRPAGRRMATGRDRASTVAG